ncbi:MAG: hypothetical protein K8Q91_03485 [Candidatus Vogelbacteria bacterium]|nr:hypothetical protein [Candidatus Vogelbacteria bacterium]
MEQNISHFKNLLLTEKEQLEAGLNEVGLPDSDQTGDWHAAPSDRSEVDMRDDVADRLEDFEEQEATEVNLEKQLRDVTLALEKIEAGTYGLCEIGGEPIETDRLEANPAARTCKIHLNEEADLS